MASPTVHIIDDERPTVQSFNSVVAFSWIRSPELYSRRHNSLTRSRLPMIRHAFYLI